MILRSTDIRGALRSRQRGFLLNPFRFGAGSVPTPVLDVLGVSAQYAYGLRLLRAAYSSSAIRVRRSSDNAEADIGFTVNGGLDVSALLSHCGAGSGFVKTWYDQSGNTRDCTQTTAGNQPQIVSSGTLINFTGSLPGVQFNGTSHILRGPAVTVAQAFSRSGVIKFLSVAANQSIFSDGANNALATGSTSGRVITYAGTSNVAFKTGASANDLATTLEIVNGASSECRWNGAATSISPGSNSSTRINIGAAYSGTGLDFQWFNGIIVEHIVISGALSGGNRTALEGNQKSYWGTP